MQLCVLPKGAGYGSGILLLSTCGVLLILEQQNCFSSGSLSGSGLFSRGAVALHWQNLTDIYFFLFLSAVWYSQSSVSPAHTPGGAEYWGDPADLLPKPH